MEVGCRLDLG